LLLLLRFATTSFRHLTPRRKGRSSHGAARHGSAQPQKNWVIRVRRTTTACQSVADIGKRLVEESACNGATTGGITNGH
jgi:hypothetical protein